MTVNSRRSRVVHSVQRSVDQFVRRVRERGRSGLVRALRLAGATVAAFVVAVALGLSDPPPLLAALTALLVVQATLASTLVTSAQRVLSVCAGVAIAVLFVSVVGLTWWSLGLLVTASIVLGQILRLGPNLVEVPISAMLVLGVGYATGAESVAVGRIAETLIGAIVGVLINLAFPPPVQTRYAGQSVQKLTDEIARLVENAASAIAADEVTEDDTARWLDDARRLNRHVPQVDRALANAEESRRLNVRALATQRVNIGLRTGLDMLEHTSVSLRTLFRSLHDAEVQNTGADIDPEYAAELRRVVARLMAETAAVVRAFGLLLQAEVTSSGDAEADRLRVALDALARTRSDLAAPLFSDPRAQTGQWEVNSSILLVVDRILLELDVEEHARQHAPDLATGPIKKVTRHAVQRIKNTAAQVADDVSNLAPVKAALNVVDDKDDEGSPPPV